MTLNIVGFDSSMIASKSPVVVQNNRSDSFSSWSEQPTKLGK
jgi:hypothetical protein